VLPKLMCRLVFRNASAGGSCIAVALGIGSNPQRKGRLRSPLTILFNDGGSFGNHGRGRRTSSGPKELVANSADDIPAVNILAGAIIAADEAEPAGIGNLYRSTASELSECSDARTADVNPGIRHAPPAKRGAITNRAGSGISFKLVPDACSEEWLPIKAGRNNGGSHSHARPSDEAIDWIGRQVDAESR
jgi:hypothetical protein